MRVVVKTDEIGLKSLGLEYPEGPVIPKPEKDVSNAAKKRSKPKSKAYSKPKKAGRKAAVTRAAASAPFRRSRWSAHDDRSPPGAAGARSAGRRHGRDAVTPAAGASGSRTVEEVPARGALGTPAPAGLV